MSAKSCDEVILEVELTLSFARVTATSEDLRLSLTALLSFVTMAVGVPAGATMPVKESAVKSGAPASGKGTTSRPSRCLNISAVRCGGMPTPADE